MQTLKREITQVPPAINNEFPFDSDWTLCYHDEEPDDEMLILEKISTHIYKGWLLYIPLLISLTFAVVSSRLPIKISAFIIFAYILYRCIYGIKVRTSQQMRFDRKEGAVIYPLYNEGRIIEQTEPFDKAPFFIKEGTEFEPQTLYLGYSDEPDRNVIVSRFDACKTWSFLVWYMDRNRPLPSGTVFDRYREKDNKRREDEGFPKPLYPSLTSDIR